MRKIYTILREDFFNAIALKKLDSDCFVLRAGTLWMDLILTEEEAGNYPFWIEEQTI